jgi:hypothetical protein
VVLLRALCFVVLGRVSKGISDQLFSASSEFWNKWQPGQPIPGLPLHTLEIILGVSLAWLLLRCVDEFWLFPILRHADLVNGVLTQLYREWFKDTPGHRISFLARRTWGWNVRVRYRFSHGSSTRFHSHAHFPRGVALAGAAWENPSTFLADVLPQDVKTKDDFRQYMRTKLRLTERQADLLSGETCRVRWIVCYGIVDPAGDFRGVLSVD